MGSVDDHLNPAPAKSELSEASPSAIAISDLKVIIQNSTMVFPSQETKRKSIFLSNIDQVLNFNVETVHFFKANPQFPPDVVTEKLKVALGKVLVPYEFLAGRLKFNSESGRLEIDCNAAGARFVVASSRCSLDDLGDLVYPNPAFSQLVVQTSDDFKTQPHNQPLCNLQITSFTCGGFAMGVSTNHAIFDGISFKLFLENLASQAFDQEKPLAVIPFTDRRLLAARNPPQVTFPHPELLKLQLPPPTSGDQDQSPNLPVFDYQQEDLVIKIFRLSAQDLALLKEKAAVPEASAPDATANAHRIITSFNVVTAYIWRCKALSNGKNLDRLSTVLYAVDLRPRLRPPLPPSYTGNAVLSAYATASCKELEEGPFSRLVEMVWEGAVRMNDEYARSAIDWGEVYKGFPHGEFMVSSWWRLGFSQVEYPWGRPLYSCPVVYHRKDIILLFPDMDGISSNAVNVLVALPSKEMEHFQYLFRKFLA